MRGRFFFLAGRYKRREAHNKRNFDSLQKTNSQLQSTLTVDFNPNRNKSHLKSDNYWGNSKRSEISTVFEIN